MNETLVAKPSSTQQGYDWHVCIVTGQPDANLLPVRDPKYKPKNVRLLETPKMKAQDKTEALKIALNAERISCTVEAFQETLDYKEMSARIGEWIYARPSSEKIAINITGGTKLMTLALFDIAMETGTDVIYLDLDTRSVVKILDQSSVYQKLDGQINLTDFLKGHGYTPINELKKFTPEPQFDTYCDWMTISHDLIKNDIGPLNGWTHKLSDDNSLSGEFESNNKIVSKCLEMNFLSCSTDNSNKLKFKNKAVLEFIKSGWLEYFTASIVDKLYLKKITDYACNLHYLDATKTKNEFDCAFVANNVLHIIECKTQNMTAEGGKNATDAIYKLDSLSKAGGVACKKMLISYRQLSPTDLARADTNNIKVVQAHQMHNLLHHLHGWIGK
jgi:Domain of unknown function (DUF1887)